MQRALLKLHKRLRDAQANQGPTLRSAGFGL